MIAYKDELRLFGEAAVTAIRMARAHVEVTIVESEALEEGVKRFDPHLVICSPPIPASALSDRLAWIELSPHSDKPSRIRCGERYWETANLTLEEFLAVVDEVEGILGESSPGNSGL